MSDGTEWHRQDAVDGIEYSVYTYEMSNVGYVNIKCHCLKWLVIHFFTYISIIKVSWS
jgi:hypothetical protein